MGHYSACIIPHSSFHTPFTPTLALPRRGGGEKRSREQRRYRWLIIALLFFALFKPPLAIPAPPAYYTLSDFQIYVRNADGSKQRTELLSSLSRQQILVGIVAADAAERDRKRDQLQAFLQQPAGMQPVWQRYQPGPYGDHFATYVISTADEQSLAGMAVLLNTMQDLATIDYALPVVQLSQAPTAPFIEFNAVFLAAAEPPRITAFIKRQPVTIISQHDTTYRFRLQTAATTNVLTVMRAFEEARQLVDLVQPTWLDIDSSQPVSLPTPTSREAAQTTSSDKTDSTVPTITARVSLDTGWNFPLVEIREPIVYHLRIDYDRQVRILPESIAVAALRRQLVQATGLPPELIDIAENKRQTEPRPAGRQRDQIAYTLRISKAGTYWIPSLPVAYSLDQSRHTTHTVESQPTAGHILTLNAHLPPRTDAIPGDLLAPPRPAQDRSWLRFLAPGALGSGLLLLLIGLLLRPWRQPRAAAAKTRSSRQIRNLYQLEWQRLHDAMPPDTPPTAQAARDWLHDGAAVVRQLLGELLCGSSTIFTGAAGISADMILAHLSHPNAEQTALVEPSLQLLQELDSRAAAPDADLSLAGQQQLCASLQHIISSLTEQEAIRVLRPSHRL